ncbi:MAG: hypothetical protein AB7P69_17045 [Candidatus Binatia bacterium]
MKANLKRILGLTALGMILLITTVTTWAGDVMTHDVTVRISPYPAYAYGSMVGARYSADNTQTIGCQIYVGQLDTSPSMGCSARNKAGDYISCFSSDPVYIEMVQGMTDSSDIFFERDPITGRCANFVIYNGSNMLR